MNRIRSFGIVLAGMAILVSSVVFTSAAHAQDRGTPFGEWRYWGADAWSTRYSPLDQIDADNFDDLEQAWLWRGDNFGPSPDYILRSTPIYADGRLFTVAGQSRAVSALDPATGEVLWMFREPHTTRWERSSRKSHGKGVAYSEVDGRGVIYLVTPAFFLHALDAETGLPLEGFGAPVPLDGFDETGTVDLLEALGHPYDPDYGIPDSIGYITNTSPPLVVNGVVVVGNSNLTGRLDTRQENVPGDILAYDARTGEHLWRFNVIPRPGEFGHETWESDAWEWSGNVNAWAPMSADAERGIVYLTTDAPTNNYFGGFRPGDNLFGNSIIALDIRTGERLWHFQGVHHDVWDRDFPLPPMLVDLTVDGELIPALVQNSKQAFTYAFNRVTGEPIWPIEEREVPPSTVPTELTSPTQPYPTRPAAFEMQGLTEDDLIDFTPELREEAIEITKRYILGPLFTPPSLKIEGGTQGSLMLPGAGGGANWPGGAYDPETGILYVHSNTIPRISGLIEADPQRSSFRYVRGNPSYILGPRGLPLLKPPYGRITAIDLNKGEIVWQVPNDGNLGTLGHASALVTRTLLFYYIASGTKLFAHSKESGERIWEFELGATPTAAPMTYLLGPKQYVVVAIGSGNQTMELVALALPGNLSVAPELWPR